MEYPDLTQIQIPTPPGFPDMPIFAVGWLNGPPERPSRAPNNVNAMLITAWMELRYVHAASGQIHVCGLCPPRPKGKKGSPIRIGKQRGTLIGSGHFLVSYRKLAYAAPVLVAHYIQEHMYHPPMQFVEAVLKGQFHYDPAIAGISRVG